MASVLCRRHRLDHTPGERRWFSEEEQNRLLNQFDRRAAQADEIAAVIEFLLGDRASYVVGSLYTADGGFAASQSFSIVYDDSPVQWLPVCRSLSWMS